jgi:hypothetical protein
MEMTRPVKTLKLVNATNEQYVEVPWIHVDVEVLSRSSTHPSLELI